MSDFFKPQPQLPFWLPPVQEIDWQLRYQSGLNALSEAERGIKAIGDEYRRMQQEFEAGLLPPELPSASHELPVEPDGGGNAGVADRADEELFKRWTWLEESNLGMRGLHEWVDAQPLMPERDSDGSNSPVSNLFAQVEYNPADTLLEEQIRFALAQAERHFMLLLIGQPDDVLALSYRARTRQATAVFLRLSMLPLGEQPTCYPPAEDYRKVVDSAFGDFDQAISLWEQGFDDEQGDIGRPIGSSTQQLLIKHSLFECYLRRYELNWAEKEWDCALVDLSGAIALKPKKIALYLARAELYHRVGQFGAQAKDCLKALALVKPHLPNSQQNEFEQGFVQLKLAMAIGNAQTVIKYSLKFWAANPMMVRAG